MTGPFYDPSQEPKPSSSRSRTRNWEQADKWGRGIPDRVGRQARIKSMAALEQKSRQAEDDPDDWFGNKNNSKSTRTPRHSARESKKISFGKFRHDERQHASPAHSPSLLARISDDYYHPNSRSHDTNRHDEGRRSRKSRNQNDSRHHREEKSGPSTFTDGRRQDIPTGPRYRGGYGR